MFSPAHPGELYDREVLDFFFFPSTTAFSSCAQTEKSGGLGVIAKLQKEY